MRNPLGFTLTDMLFTLAAVLVALVFVGAAVEGPEGPRRVQCAKYLNGIYKAMYTYAAINANEFPVAGNSDAKAAAIGFAEGDRKVGKGAKLDNNVTASLWLLVREGNTWPKTFICPSDRNGAEDLLTHDGTGEGQPVEVNKTYDLVNARGLSYSMMNMHHVAIGRNWNPDVSADWSLMADDNNNSHGLRHTTSKESPNDPQRTENSTNHATADGSAGQNVMAGDGHVSWQTTPFAGPKWDNVYAMLKRGKNAPPTLGNSDGDAATDAEVAKRDVVLLPITGNGGGAGSLDPTD